MNWHVYFKETCNDAPNMHRHRLRSAGHREADESRFWPTSARNTWRTSAGYATKIAKAGCARRRGESQAAH